MIPTEKDIVRTLHIQASPKTVFGFFTEADKLIQWKGESAVLDPVPGGIFQVCLDGKKTISGHYVEVVPYERVVFTWGWENEDSLIPPGHSLVEVTLQLDTDATLLHLIHRDLPEEFKQFHADGWDFYLPQLVSVVSTNNT